LAIDTRINTDGSADVFVDVSLDSSSDTETEIQLSLEPRNFRSTSGARFRSIESIGKGISARRYVLHVEKA
jgi:hypothetical protein